MTTFEELIANVGHGMSGLSLASQRLIYDLGILPWMDREGILAAAQKIGLRDRVVAIMEADDREKWQAEAVIEGREYLRAAWR